MRICTPIERFLAIAIAAIQGGVALGVLACAGDSGSASPAAASTELLTERDGRLQWSRFERCHRHPPEAGESAETAREFLLHASAPAGSMTLDAFAGAARSAAFLEQSALLASDPSELRCRTVPAPEQELDFEIRLDWADGSFHADVVDVVDGSAMTPRAPRSGESRCAEDHDRRLHCARSESGTAVVTAVGQVLCARGSCAQNARGDWGCSRAIGGWAETTDRGVHCDLGCYTPTTRECSSF